MTIERVVVMAAARDRERLKTVDELTAGMSDLEAGVRIDDRVSEVQIDTANRDRGIAEAAEVHLDDVIDRDTEVRLDRFHQEVRPIGVIDVDAIELAIQALVGQQRHFGVARDGEDRDRARNRVDTDDLDHVAALATNRVTARPGLAGDGARESRARIRTDGEDVEWLFRNRAGERRHFDFVERVKAPVGVEVAATQDADDEHDDRHARDEPGPSSATPTTSLGCPARLAIDGVAQRREPTFVGQGPSFGARRSLRRARWSAVASVSHPSSLAVGLTTSGSRRRDTERF